LIFSIYLARRMTFLFSVYRLILVYADISYTNRAKYQKKFIVPDNISSRRKPNSQVCDCLY